MLVLCISTERHQYKIWNNLTYFFFSPSNVFNGWMDALRADESSMTDVVQVESPHRRWARSTNGGLLALMVARMHSLDSLPVSQLSYILSGLDIKLL